MSVAVGMAIIAVPFVRKIRAKGMSARATVAAITTHNRNKGLLPGHGSGYPDLSPLSTDPEAAKALPLLARAC